MVRRAALLASMLVCAACGALIGLDEYPLAEPAADAATPDASAGPTGFCAKADAAFCDDFDDVDASLARWQGLPYGPQGKPLFGDASLTIVPSPLAPSAPNVLLATASAPVSGDFAFAATAHTASLPEGATGTELSFELAAEQLEGAPDAGPVDASGIEGTNPDRDLRYEFRTIVASLATLVNGEPNGLIVFLTPSSVAVAVTRDLSVNPDFTADDTYGRLGRANLVTLGTLTSTRFTLMLGEAAAVRARARTVFPVEPACPRSPALAIVGSNLTVAGAKVLCFALKDEAVTPREVSLLIGAMLPRIVGSARVRFDDVVVRALP